MQITHSRLVRASRRHAHRRLEYHLQNSRSVNGPAYDLLLVAHVASALVGFGAIAAGGVAAASSQGCDDPANDTSVRRFFKRGRDWPARMIFLVPVLGLILLFGGPRSDQRAAWPWIGLCIWIVAVGVASGICWPAERAAQEALSELTGAPGEDGTSLVAEFRASCRRMELATGAISVCFVAAVAVMIIQP
jgi:hypothetical protein